MDGGLLGVSGWSRGLMMWVMCRWSEVDGAVVMECLLVWCGVGCCMLWGERLTAQRKELGSGVIYVFGDRGNFVVGSHASRDT